MTKEVAQGLIQLAPLFILLIGSFILVACRLKEE